MMDSTIIYRTTDKCPTTARTRLALRASDTGLISFFGLVVIQRGSRGHRANG